MPRIGLLVLVLKGMMEPDASSVVCFEVFLGGLQGNSRGASELVSLCPASKICYHPTLSSLLGLSTVCGCTGSCGPCRGARLH
jgi:hypothetical protein